MPKSNVILIPRPQPSAPSADEDSTRDRAVSIAAYLALNATTLAMATAGTVYCLYLWEQIVLGPAP